MITTQRAIEMLKVQKSFLADINIDAHIAYKIAIESLEKQIAKITGYSILSGNEIYTCPNCGYAYVNSNKITDYCNSCGQSLIFF